MSLSRCQRGPKCSIRSHKHDLLPESLERLFSRYLTTNKYSKEYYARNYNAIIYGKYDKKLICDFLKDMMIKVEGKVNIFEAVLIFTVFNESLNMRLFSTGSGRLYNAAKKKYDVLFKSNSKFAEEVPKFDIHQDYHEFILHCFISKKSRKSLSWNKFSEEVRDADNVFSDSIISFL
jgi:hypothetical protein